MRPHLRRTVSVLLPLSLALAGTTGPEMAHGVEPRGAATAIAAAAQDAASPVPEHQGLEASLEAQGLGQAYRDGQVTVVGSLSEARSSKASTTYIVVSDGVSHVAFTRGSTAQDGAHATVEVDGTTYGVTFTDSTDAVPLIAYDVGDDATRALTSAIDQAAALGKGVRLGAGQHYATTGSLTIPDAVPFLDGAGAVLNASIPGGTEDAPANVLVQATSSSGTTVTDLTLDLKNQEWTRGIQGNAISNTTISDVQMLNVAFVGINMVADSGPLRGLTIRDNRIKNVLGDKNTEGKPSIQLNSARQTDAAFKKSNEPVWDQYTTDGTTAANLHENSGHTITGNVIDGGYYGIGLSGVSSSTISRNTLGNNMRNISMQSRSNGNTVEGNYLSDSRSSAVHVAYESNDNTVRGNTVVTHRATAQGLLQAYQGSKSNIFSDNRVSVVGATRPSWVLYAGTDSTSTTFTGNIVSGSANHAFVAVESIWDEDSAASNLPDGMNPWTFMQKGKVTSPKDGTPAPFYGGRGDLDGITVQGNILMDSWHSPALVYAGAESSDGRDHNKTLVGNITGLQVSGNDVIGNSERQVVTHEGSTKGIGPARVSGDTSLGTTHKGANAQSGGKGDDVFILDSPQDTVTDEAGTDTAYATVTTTAPEGVEALTLLGGDALEATGNAAGNTLTGNPADNRLAGEGGDDVLRGGEGSDTLTGGEGADTFTFDTIVDHGTDTITDFTPGQDKIALSSTVFGKLEGQWFAQAGQTTSATRVIQDGDTLYFDADGSGTSYEAVAFARLPQGVQLSAGDLTVIP